VNTLYTYSGKIAFPEVAPSLMDIAISLSREGRYAGAGMRWWPVVLHTFVVCDLLPPQLKLHGLLHDASETITGDVPKPAKTDAVEHLEKKITESIYRHFGIGMPNEDQRRQVKEADRKTFRGEIYTVGTQALQEHYERCPEAEELVYKYVREFDYKDCLDAGGRAPIEFMRRFRLYKDMLTQARIMGRSTQYENKMKEFYGNREIPSTRLHNEL
jgi:5'-deoxynucleotidase YfbR-like HD superfamily hydrolase